MMTGHVEFGHAFLKVLFLRQGGDVVPVEFVIDTGFTSYLTLPPSDIAALGLSLSDITDVV